MKKRYESKLPYHYFYEIRNNINGHFYYGIHSTDDFDDGYMGSGKRLNYAYKKYGIENFTKTILKEFDTREEAAAYEAEIVTETLVKDDNCYNCTLGGDMVALNIGKVVCLDKETNEWITIPQEEYYKNKDKYSMPNTGYVYCLNKNGESILVTQEEYKKGKEQGLYTTASTNKISVKDKYGKRFLVDKTDPRYISGELVNFWQDRKHTEQSKEKMRKAHIGKHVGEKNQNYGKCWITKDEMNKSIPKKDLEKWIAEGWVKGRYAGNVKTTKWIEIPKEQIIELRTKGLTWINVAKELGIGQTLRYRLKKKYNL